MLVFLRSGNTGLVLVCMSYYFFLQILLFLLQIPQVRAWAKRAGLHGEAQGFLSSYPLAVMRPDRWASATRRPIGKVSATCCSAVSAPIFASKYAFCSIYQSIPDYKIDIFEIWQNFADHFATFAKSLLNFHENR